MDCLDVMEKYGSSSSIGDSFPSSPVDNDDSNHQTGETDFNNTTNEPHSDEQQQQQQTISFVENTPKPTPRMAIPATRKGEALEIFPSSNSNSSNYNNYSNHLHPTNASNRTRRRAATIDGSGQRSGLHQVSNHSSTPADEEVVASDDDRMATQDDDNNNNFGAEESEEDEQAMSLFTALNSAKVDTSEPRIDPSGSRNTFLRPRSGTTRSSDYTTGNNSNTNNSTHHHQKPSLMRIGQRRKTFSSNGGRKATISRSKSSIIYRDSTNHRPSLSTGSSPKKGSNLITTPTSARSGGTSFDEVGNKLKGQHNHHHHHHNYYHPPKMLTTGAENDTTQAPSVDLNKASINHAKAFLNQLLWNYELSEKWEMVLVEPLLKCAQNIDLNVKGGDSIDIRHYVKLKRVSGGSLKDTKYVDGIVFSKTLALKTMARTIEEPRILLITFPIEYSRAGNHFMSLEPVIAQETEYLRKLVRRITALRPQVILAGDRVSGIALKMLSDNGIAVATDVKNTVINRVSRYTRADIISSIDKLAVKPTLGKCERFEVKTYRYRDTAKSFMFLTGIPKELGCTILLRGSDAVTLAKVKAVTEFMVYVVFNLKLETSLMRDEFVLIPSKDPQEQADTNYGTPAEQDNPGYFHGLLKMQARKILSSSPFVNFGNPYFFQEARDLEDRLVEMSKENESLDLSDEKNIAESYHKLGLDRNLEDLPGTATYAIDLIKAVNNQRYQRLHELWTVYKRQWEQMYAQYPDMFDPSSHQNIVVLFSIVCNETATPCVGPEKLTIDFYSENDVTLGQFVEHICVSADDDCPEECGKHLLGHYRSYVHGKGRVNIVLEKLQSRLPGYQDTILMWSWCKICQITTPIVPMSGTTWKYSFGKYLELSFWSTGLSFRAGVCNHDIYRDHIRYFGFHDMAVRFQYDPVGLLEVVAPKAKLIWNPEKDIKHKLEVYDGIIKRVNRFWDSVANRLNNVIIEGLEPEKMEECKAKVDELRQRCEEERGEVLEMVKSIYLTSGVTDLLPLNGALRTIQDKVVMWDSEFIQFESKYLPSEKDVARITAQQLKKIFIDKQDDTTPDPLETPSSEKDLKSDITPPVSSAASSIVKTTDEKREEPVDDVDTGEKVEQQASKSTDCIPADNPTDDEFLYSKTAADPVKYHSNEITSVSEPVTRAASPKRESNTPGGRVKEEVSRMEETMAKQRKEQQVGYFFRKPTSDRAQLPSTPEIDDSEIENGENSLFLSNSMQPMDENTIPKGENLDNSTESVKDTDEITKEDGLKQAKRSSQTSTKSTDESYRRPISFEKSRGSSIPTLKPGAEKTSSTLGKSTPVSQPPAEGKRVRSNNNNNQSASSLSFRKRFSDKISLPAQTLRQRFGSSTKELEKQLLKNSKQPGQTKVSSLAKHFDQLSKEFEKERAKERSIIEQGRVKAFPVARARPVVEVFKNVEEAVEELSDHEDDKKKMNNIKGAKSTSDTLSSRNDNYSTQYIDSSGGRQHLHNKDTENLEESNDKTSETDGTQVETDHSTLPTDSSRTNSEAGLIPEKETAEHTAEKQTLMQTLARFWADRTSSGWESLDYPMNPTEHIFADSDIIIREDEPSSLIAFCLNSPDYLEKLKNMGQNKAQKQPVELDELVPENASSYINETDNALESQMLKKTGIHLKYQFQEGTANMSCKIFFSEQFDAFRKQAGCDEHYIQSLSRCVKWDSSGGKSGSAFLKTLDDRLVVKQLSPSELDAFVKFAPSYFEYMAQAFFHVVSLNPYNISVTLKSLTFFFFFFLQLPTVLAKIFGFYQIQIRNPITGKTIKMDLIVMENLFYNRKMNRVSCVLLSDIENKLTEKS